MKVLKELMVAVALTATIGTVALTPAKAGGIPITWDFQDHLGALGTTQTFSSVPGAYPLNAAGFLFGTTNLGTAAIDFSTPANLYGKNLGGNENGLGMQSPTGDSTGNNEIQANTSFIRIQLPPLLQNIQFAMGSSTVTEGWDVFGSTAATTGYSLLLAGTDQTPIFHSLSALCPACTFFTFFATGTQTPGGLLGNVLINEITAEVPLPGAVGLFATGLGLMGLLGWRRKRKAPVAIATA